MKIEVGKTYKFELGEQKNYTLANNSNISVVVSDRNGNYNSARWILKNDYYLPLVFIGKVEALNGISQVHIVISMDSLKLVES